VMDGYDLLSHMKKRYPGIPVIVMSAFFHSEVAARLRDLGVSQCIEKPLSVNALEEMILLTLPLFPEGSGGVKGATT